MQANPEMDQAQAVQARLLRTRGPRLRTLDYAGRCRQARRIGGDTFDFIEAAPGRMVLIVADVAGKGLSAALMMAALHATLRARYARSGADMSDVLGDLNTLLVDSTAPQHYASVFLSEFDDATGRLRYVNCGHVPPLLLRRDDRVERLDSTTVPLGLFEGWHGRVTETTLSPGDTLLLYSDGITEMTNHRDEEFGERRLIDSLRARRSLSPPTLVEALLGDCHRFGGTRQHDDMTLVVARCRRPSPSTMKAKGAAA